MYLLALAFKLPGRVANVFTWVSDSSITAIEPELKQTAKIPGKPGFHRTFPRLSPVKTTKRSLPLQLTALTNKWQKIENQKTFQFKFIIIAAFKNESTCTICTSDQSCNTAWVAYTMFRARKKIPACSKN